VQQARTRREWLRSTIINTNRPYHKLELDLDPPGCKYPLDTVDRELLILETING
jgi:hypothetical protein